MCLNIGQISEITVAISEISEEIVDFHAIEKGVGIGDRSLLSRSEGLKVGVILRVGVGGRGGGRVKRERLVK